jgi:hypothetical protein
MQQLGFIMKGLAIVYQIQVATLEKESKALLSMLNGDHVWNMYVKKNMQKGGQYRDGKKSKARNAAGGARMGAAGKVMRALAFNIMDVKQLLDYTKGRLDNL